MTSALMPRIFKRAAARRDLAALIFHLHADGHGARR
jgi:hypothetical protein